MINLGLVFIASAAWFAGIGLAGYAAARRSTSKSRYAALSVFGHGAFASSGAIALFAILHLHGLWPFSLHVHEPSEALGALLACDLELSCGIFTILALTGVVLLASFIVSQTASRLLLRRYRPLVDESRSGWLAGRSSLRSNTRLLVVHDRDVDAFSFAILRLDRRRLFRAEDVIVLTSRLLDILADDEVSAVVAHEAAHVEARDDRYIPFFHTLSLLLFFDPVLRVLRRRVARHHEFAADAESARTTRQPLSLARALLKVYLEGMPVPHATGLFGRGSRAELLHRIEALLALDAAGLRPAR